MVLNTISSFLLDLVESPSKLSCFLSDPQKMLDLSEMSIEQREILLSKKSRLIEDALVAEATLIGNAQTGNAQGSHQVVHLQGSHQVVHLHR